MTGSQTLSEPPAVGSRPVVGFRLTIRHLWLLVPFVWMAWIVGRPVGDNSFLWHVRAGTAQLEAGRVLTADPFSYTMPGEPWRTQSWLAELGYGFLENLTGGIGWVHIMLFVVVSLTLVAAGMAVHRQTRSLLPTAGILLVISWQGSPFSVPRPVLFSYLALAVLVLVLQRADADLWLVPPLLWAWAAVHGSFVVGLGVVVLDAIRLRSSRRAAAAAAGLVLASLTAHGVGVWQILIDFLAARGALDLIQEWQAPEFTNPFVLPYALVLAGVVVAAVRGRITMRDLVLIGPIAFFGLLANRNLYPAVLVLAPFAARALQGVGAEVRRRSDSQIVNWAFVAAMALFAVLGFNREVTLNDARFPGPEVLAAIDDTPMFHGSAMGGYLIYAEWPERLVFIDDRGEFFGEDAFRRFHDIRIGCAAPTECSAGAGYREVFAAFGIRQAILQPEWPLVGALTTDGWVERHRDEHFVVMAAPTSD